MKLAEIVESLEAQNEEETIFAAEPWSCSSEAVIASEPEDGSLPAIAAARCLTYFVEVSVAKEFLDGCRLNETAPKCERLINTRAATPRRTARAGR
jgi:hypothetical protein